MIVMGVVNVCIVVLIGVGVNYVLWEVVFGVGGVIYIGVMIIIFIWVLDDNMLVYFIIVVVLGFCDVVW